MPPRIRLTDDEYELLMQRRLGINRTDIEPYLPIVLGMPDGEDEISEPLRIESERALVLSDIHLGFHDLTALEKALSFGRKAKIDTVVLNGDILDFYACSTFDKRPNKSFIVHEIKLARELFASLRTIYPSANIYYKKGNHEERYDKYLAKNGKELFGMEEFTLEYLLHLDKYGVTAVADRQLITIGKLNIYHGHELGGGGVHVASGIVNKTGSNILCGHWHKTQDYTKTRLNEQPIAGFAVGCLCKLKPFYLPSNQWNHGFAFVETESNGNFRVHNKRIIDGLIV